MHVRKRLRGRKESVLAARYPLLFRQLCKAVHGQGVCLLSFGIRRGQNAKSRRAVQPRNKVRSLPRIRPHNGRRLYRHRSLLRHRPQRRRQSLPFKGGGRRQGPDLFFEPGHAAPARTRALSPRFAQKGRGAKARRRERLIHRKKEGFNGHLLYRRAQLPRVPFAVPAQQTRQNTHSSGRRGRRAHRAHALHAGTAQGRQSRRKAGRKRQVVRRKKRC